MLTSKIQIIKFEAIKQTYNFINTVIVNYYK